jgi:integrase
VRAEVLPEGKAGFSSFESSSLARRKGDGGDTPSIATQHFRRSAIRLLFRLARYLGLAEGDPTLDLDLPPRSSLNQRPLTADEMVVCRTAALRTLTATRQPAAWALAEATARSSEIPRIRTSDVCLDDGLVWIHGGSRTEARFGKLTSWGLVQIARRIAVLEAASGATDSALVYSGKGSAESGQASSCIAISVVLRRAGLAGGRGDGAG